MVLHEQKVIGFSYSDPHITVAKKTRLYTYRNSQPSCVFLVIFFGEH